MRYETAQQVMRLALAMRGSASGLCLDDIMEMFEVTERTAHRLRDAVVEIFPEAIATLGPDRRRYWRLPPATVDRLVSFTADELAALESARRLLGNNGFEETATDLAGLAAKLRALLSPTAGRRLEPDVEALVEAEGIAIRPGPRPLRNQALVHELREAIKGCQCVRLRYRYRGRPDVADIEVEPYGILLGSRHYLLAHRPGSQKGPFLRMYSLPEIEAAERSEHSFERDPGVSLQDFADQSFGIFQEPLRYVVWRFHGRGARDARQFLFHPSQVVEELPGGAVQVSFHAGGLLEMCWHLFTWGDAVEVVEPAELRELYRRCLEAGGAPPPASSEVQQSERFGALEQFS